MRLGFLSIVGLAVAGWLGCASLSFARPPYKKALADHFGPLLAKKLNDCRTCHLPEQPGAKHNEEEKPHNVFGKRLVAVKAQLRKAGKGTDIIARMEAIAEEDADGDGATNLLELLAGRFPGEAEDKPSATEFAAARKAQGIYEERKTAYAWRPFDPVERPVVPKVNNTAWSRNPIDAFLTVAHDKHGLRPRPEAPKHVLLRRLYLDLIGLPPTPEEIRAFINDSAPDAYEKVVDRLLANPHYGERWGRHWMDIWRYSDWTGYGAEVRDSQPHIWRWRDWIVEALNEDKPYDQMIREMLAGDEIAPTDPKVLRATGFLVRNWFKFNRDVWLDRSIEHTAKAFLGVTLNCARCHDHFFDPITQKEYYQFRAFFEPHDIRTDPLPGQPDTTKDGLVRIFDAKLDAPTFLYVRGEDKNPDKKNLLGPGVPGALGGNLLELNPITLPAPAVFPDKQPWIIAETLQTHREAITKARTALAQAKAGKEPAQLEVDLAEAKLAALEAVLHAEKLAETAPKAADLDQAGKEAQRRQRQAALLEAKKTLLVAEKALAEAKGPAQPAAKKKVEEAVLALKKVDQANQQPLTAAYTPRATRSFPPTSTGRRLALARWIADPQNPLTARVAVNHLWLRHFGAPLVPSVFDFGANGQPPTHPALLDWLAAEFMSPSPLGGEGSGVRGKAWSMKHLHRLLVTSAAYRMDSTPDAANVAKDQDNRYLWRMNSRRLEAEIVRDAVLAVAGQLDPTFGGPELDQNLGLTTRRRSIYYRHAPERMMEFMLVFDSANVTECYCRTESVVPQQALAMANSVLVQTQARLLARKLAEKNQEAATFIQAAFDRVLGRAPTAEEASLCGQFLTQQAALLRDPKNLSGFQGGAAGPVPPSSDPQLRARENLVHVLFNHNEFVTVR